MQIDGHVQALREDLARVAAVGDESTARAAELLALALEASFGRRLQEAPAGGGLERDREEAGGAGGRLVADRRDAGEVLTERLDVAVDLHDGSMTSD